MRMFLLFSHSLNQKQKDQAKSSYGVSQFVPLPPQLQQDWSSIPPELGELEPYLQPFKTWLQNNSQKGDLALIQGDFGACCQMARFARSVLLTPVYATTQRTVTEKPHDDKMVKTSVFEHIRFREYQ